MTGAEEPTFGEEPCSHLIPGTCKRITSCGKREFSDVIKPLRGEVTLGFRVGPVIGNCKRRETFQTAVRDLM